jgi:thioredoxin-related protein
VKVIFLFFVLLNLVSATEKTWSENWVQACARAHKEKKDLLVYFTGSDWSPWCIALQKEVLSKKAFLDFVKEKYILVQLDYPEHKVVDELLRAQNDKLLKKYFVRSFPTIYFLDSQQRPYGDIRYEGINSKQFIEQIKKFINIRDKRNLMLAASKKLHGVAKAQKLSETIALLDNSSYLVYYRDIEEGIYKLDPGDVSGFKKMQAQRLSLSLVESEVLKLVRKQQRSQALVLIDEFIFNEKVTGELRQEALFDKLVCYKFEPQNYDLVEALMDEVIKVRPASRLALKCRKIKTRISHLRKVVPDESSSIK